MAESRGSLIAKSVQKHAGRAKEKILQNLGKVDKTADEIFDEHLLNFNRQQNAANKLQKEFSNYIRCIRATQAASRSLLEVVSEVYEGQWAGHEVLYVQTQSIDMLWQDFCNKLADQVLLPLNTYQGQFTEMRKKIDKRGRKLVDYDSQRHSFQALQTNVKKRDEIKLAKGRELLEEAKHTYEMLNSELHDELPALYDSRILFLVTSLQSLFNAEHSFHDETSKIYGEMEMILDKLATDCQRGSYTVKKTNGSSSLPRSPRPASVQNSPTFNDVRVEVDSEYKPPPTKVVARAASDDDDDDDDEAEVTDASPVAGTTGGELPAGVLYKVAATYKYNKEDVDELSFEIGEVINVVEYDDPEEQEEGWLMGVKETTGEKGMFPANFTRPL